MIRAAIMGATGYAGGELIRILLGHPEVEITALASRQFAGRSIDNAFPSFRGLLKITCETPDPKVIATKADVVFTAVPHGTAMEAVPVLLEEGKKVIDISADFRLKNRAVYEEWYIPHTAPHLLEEAVYGLPELYRETIASANLIANPGCYPTAVILGAAPLVRHGWVKGDALIADAKSGTSGAGRSSKQSFSFCEVNEALRAYSVPRHRHLPEMEQVLADIAGGKFSVTFVPHLIPIDRGILATLYIDLVRPTSSDELLEVYHRSYQNEPFVRVLPPDCLSDVAMVRGSNFCDISLCVDQPSNRAIVLSAIDNLVKGAAGSAVQNMNIQFGLPERSGLESVPLFP
ncbi:MAG: N-acetyl-gamma-glutamyl-phosphate reductase [Deltaproteobacteria bacterium]|nr:N-acetyl-gamma-glutamyl-phosphate reductase [Deltaproteobacteria bacterium]